MAAGDTFQITMVQQLNGVSMANIFYLDTIDDLGSVQRYTDAIAAFQNQIQSLITAFQVLSVEMECYLIRQVVPITEPTEVFVVAGGGARPDPPCSANVASKLRHYSGIGDKNRRGRWFFGGVSEVDVNANGFNEDMDVIFNLFGAAVVLNIVDSGRTYRMQHFSKTLNQYFNIDSVVPTPQPIQCRPRTPGICSIA